MIRRKHHIPEQEVDDVVASALLDFTIARSHGRECGDGLFLVIAHRRACDFWRTRHAELPLDAASRVANSFEDRHLDEREIQQSLFRCTLHRGVIERRRLLWITNRILGGESFSEACRASGVPRGSQTRYRERLRGFLEDPVVWRELLGDRTRKGPRPHRGTSRLSADKEQA